MNKKEFTGDLRKLGVEKGMNLMVHSSLRRIGANSGRDGAGFVIEALREIIGSGATMMVPTISGNVKPDQPVFHVDYSPSSVGWLTNVFREQPDAVRSLHPVHSVAAAGPDASFFTRGHLEANTPWSPDSPFGRMVRDDRCFILFLGVNLRCNSCFHALEIEARLPGMHTPSKTLLHVIRSCGGMLETEHHWHDRRTRRFFEDMEGVLHESGCLSLGRTGAGISRLVRATAMRKVILDILSRESWLMTCPPEDNDFIWEP